MNETLVLAAKIACENHFHNIMARMTAKEAAQNDATKMSPSEKKLRDDSKRHVMGTEDANKVIDAEDRKKKAMGELKRHLGNAGKSLGISAAVAGGTYLGSRALGYSKGRSAAHAGIAAGATELGSTGYMYRNEITSGAKKLGDKVKGAFGKKNEPPKGNK